MGEDELMQTGEQIDLGKYVTDEGGIWSLRDVEKIRGWNNIEYGAGLSGKNTPSTKLSMNRAYIPPRRNSEGPYSRRFRCDDFPVKGEC